MASAIQLRSTPGPFRARLAGGRGAGNPPRRLLASPRAGVLPSPTVASRPPRPLDLPPAFQQRVACPACRHAGPVTLDTRCESCGASLEDVLRATRGPLPPLPPRRLTRGQRHAVLRPKVERLFAMGTLLGALGLVSAPVFAVFLRPVLLASAIFLVVGFQLRRAGWPPAIRREQRHRLRALEWGVPAEAVITYVGRHVVPSVQAGRVAEVRYAFTVHGETFIGAGPSSQEVDALRPVGQPVWVVYVPENPHLNALWPPVL